MGNAGETLGERIARLRGRESQDDFSARSGVPRRTLQNIENNITRSPGIGVLEKIAAALNVSIGDLRGEKAQDPLPEWAKQITERLTAIENASKQPAILRSTSAPYQANDAHLLSEIVACWPPADKRQKYFALFFGTGNPNYLNELEEDFVKEVLSVLRFHHLLPKKTGLKGK